MDSIKFYSFNARGLRNIVKRKLIFKLMKEKCPSGIFFLQETHSHRDDEINWKDEWGSEILFSHGLTNKCGVCILLPKNFDMNTISSIRQDDNGRYILVNCTIGNKNIAMGNVYAPVRCHEHEQLSFLNSVKELLNSSESDFHILGGDWNTVLDGKLDKYGGDVNNCTNKYTEELKTVLEVYELCDVIRLFYDNKKVYTRVQRSPVIMSRIDHWFVSAQLSGSIRTAKVTPGIKSDHSIIEMEINLNSNEKGKGLWKFNADLLRDNEYTTYINNYIDELKLETNELADKGIRWEYIKCKIREFTIQFAIKKNERKERIKLNLYRKYMS